MRHYEMAEKYPEAYALAQVSTKIIDKNMDQLFDTAEGKLLRALELVQKKDFSIYVLAQLSRLYRKQRRYDKARQAAYCALVEGRWLLGPVHELTRLARNECWLVGQGWAFCDNSKGASTGDLIERVNLALARLTVESDLTSKANADPLVAKELRADLAMCYWDFARTVVWSENASLYALAEVKLNEALVLLGDSQEADKIRIELRNLKSCPGYQKPSPPPTTP